MILLYALLAGFVFGIGLLLSGLANPAKVLAFLDLAGSWDPSLLFVMGGALLVAAPAFALAARCWSRRPPLPWRRGAGARSTALPCTSRRKAASTAAW